MIPRQEYVERMARLRQRVGEAGLDAFIVSAEDSIYYLTGVSYRPLERPFFILVRPSAAPVLLVPALEQEHLRAAPNVEEVHHYWDYPAPAGKGWADRLLELLAGLGALGVEPSATQEIVGRLMPLAPRTLPLVEELRLVKSRASSLVDTAPERDLWHAVAERIGAGGARVAAFQARARRRFSFTLPQLAAASIALMVLSGGMVWLARSGDPRADFPATIGASFVAFSGLVLHARSVSDARASRVKAGRMARILSESLAPRIVVTLTVDAPPCSRLLHSF